MPGRRGRIVFDGHCDTPSRIVSSPFSLDERNSDGHIDLPRMLEGGLTAQFFACCVDPGHPRREWEPLARRMIEGTAEAVKQAGGIDIALGRSDIESALEKGLISVMLSVEGGHVISSADSLETFYNLGMRSLAVTWKNSNRLADSSEGERRWGGLSPFGREIVGEMNRMGILIDCSHASRETFFDIMERSSKPVFLSHSCVSGICDIPRNADDSQLRAIAGNGGVICINFFPAFLDEGANADIMKVWAPYRERKNSLALEYGNDPERAGRELLPAAMKKLEGIRMPPLSRVADHIEYAAGAAGIDHVGIGSDFDGIPVTPGGLEDISMLPSLERELSARGFSDEEIDRIMGANLLRVVGAACT